MRLVGATRELPLGNTFRSRRNFELTGERSVGAGKLLGRILDQHPRPALFVAGSPVRVIVDTSARPENFCTTTPVPPAVSPEVPLGDARYQRNVRGPGWEPRRGQRSRKGRGCELPSPHGASPPQIDEARSDSGSCEERSKKPATWIKTTRP